MGDSNENVNDDTKHTVNNNATPFDTSKYKASEQSEDYGYYFYPERGDTKVKTFWENLWSEGRGRKFKCEANVTWCVENRKLIFLFLFNRLNIIT